MFTRSEKILGAYAGVLTVTLVAVMLTGARSGAPAKFDTLDVQRINIREPDGTLRMVLSSNGRFPGAIIAGKEYPHPRTQAGMLFFDDEGTENGGLIFAGKKGADGKIMSGVSLTFDRYRQDQQLQLMGQDHGGRHFAGLTVNDVIDGTKYPVFGGTHKEGEAPQAITRRLYVGKTPSGDAVLHLGDASGKPRLAIKVTPEGEGAIMFLDEKGQPTKMITADDIAAAKP
jgi:hypothetical protein